MVACTQSGDKVIVQRHFNDGRNNAKHSVRRNYYSHSCLTNYKDCVV